MLLARLFAILVVLHTTRLGAQGQEERVLELVHQAVACARGDASSDPGYKALMLADAAPYLMQLGEGQIARDLLQESHQLAIRSAEGYRDYALCEVAIRQAQAGLVEEALATQKLISKEFKMCSPLYHEECLSGIALRVAERSDFSRAISICREIENGDWHGTVLAKLASVAQAQGLNELRNDLVNQAVASLDSHAGMDDKPLRLQFIVEHLAFGGLKHHASELTKAAASKADSEYEWICLIRMEAACGNVEGVQGANAELVSAYGFPVDDSLFIACLVQAQAMEGWLEEALLTARKLAGARDYPLAIRQIAAAMVQAGRLDEALRTSNSIPPEDRSFGNYGQTWLDVAGAAYRNGDRDKSLELLGQAQAFVDAEGFSSWHRNYFGVAQAYGEFEQESVAERWAHALVSPAEKYAVLMGLASGIQLRSTAKQ